ncbi:MAG: membrane protein [Porticoccaceae bacterium]|nr:MAG: membrane protein [Porticoccaceae bacterium]
MVDPHQGVGLFAMVLIGVAGGGHCLGMCGGIAGALSLAGPGRGWAVPLYNAGRIGGYALLGAAVGAAGAWGGEALGWGGVLRALAGGLMVLAGLYLLGVGRAAPLEALGLRLWRQLRPLAGRLLPADRPLKVLLLGGLWGFLPCGLTYTALALAAVSGGAAAGALAMAAFGIGTLPALAAGGWAAAWLGAARLRGLSGAALVAFGLWTAAAPLVGLPGDHDHGAHRVHQLR